MINEQMYEWGAAPSVIRQLYAYGLDRKAEIGEDAVFDFSIGNPSVPAPDEVTETITDLLKMPPAELHGYTPATGLASARDAIARNINRRFGTSYTADNFYLTMGAAASLDASIHALTLPGDEIIVISPYFPEYRTWIEMAGCTCVEVPARQSDFQIDAEAMAAAITPKTKAVIVNSPNNPVGSVYTPENLHELAVVMRAKSVELGSPIFLISDEPYRELIYGDNAVSWMPSIYEDTIVCYSWSKSFSLPGERIGYVLVPDSVTDARHVYTAVAGAGRGLGYICASSMFQRVIERCVDAPVDVDAYASNRKLLTGILDEIGYEYIEPQGAFYLWMKALEPDAGAFSERAKSHELLLVPSDSFGTPGWVRLGYCVSSQTIENSAASFKALYDSYRD